MILVAVNLHSLLQHSVTAKCVELSFHALR
jgi:hypothetical protein